MGLTFEQGDPQAPRGHALVYFRSGTAQGQILMTYVVVLPMSVDISKYMPPFLNPQIGAMAPTEFSCFPFPPVPEPVEPGVSLVDLAGARNDDLVFGGIVSPSDVTGMLGMVNDIVQAYAEAYTQRNQVAPSGATEEGGSASLGVNEVLYGFMDQPEKLGELTRLVGKLRFAAEAADASLLREVEEEVRALGRYLPAEYRIDRILDLAHQSTAVGSRLVRLYVERCYKLSREEYREMQALEEEIQALEGRESQ